GVPVQQPAASDTGPRRAGGGAAGPDQATPRAGDRLADILLAVDKIDHELDDWVRRNAELQKEVRALRAELDALRFGRASRTRNLAGPAKRPAAPGRGTDLRPPSSAPPRKASKVGSRPPTYLRQGGLIIVIAPDGNKVAVYSESSGNVSSVELPVAKG